MENNFDNSKLRPTKYRVTATVSFDVHADSYAEALREIDKLENLEEHLSWSGQSLWDFQTEDEEFGWSPINEPKPEPILCDVVTVTLEVQVPRGVYFPEPFQLEESEKSSVVEQLGELDAHNAEIEWQVLSLTKQSLENIGLSVDRAHASSLGTKFTNPNNTTEGVTK